MSYILDALKKIEQKRDREDPLRKPTFSGDLPPERKKKKALWPYFLLAALLLNAVAISFFLWSPKPEKASTAAAVQPIPGAAPAIVTESPVNIPETSKDRKEAPLKKENVLPPARPAEREPKEATVTVPTPVKPPVTERAAAGVKPAPEKGTAAPTERIFSLGELPSGIRSTLPEFRVSGHAYSPERQTRVARVNDKILQEGQELSPGLRVEEIVQEGIIFSYQGYRFRIVINGNR
jgi:general secretion pathway protein B